MKENHSSLPDNYNVSLKRLDKLKMRLDKKENLLRSYGDIFQEQIKLGIIEKKIHMVYLTMLCIYLIEKS